MMTTLREFLTRQNWSDLLEEVGLFICTMAFALFLTVVIAIL